jgi:hypothetical protein
MMTDAEKPDFVSALATLAALKPGAALTKEQFTAWWMLMRSSWTLAEFQEACRKLAEDSEFMPNPYHFAQLRKKAADTTPAEAWEKVCQLVRAGSDTDRNSVAPRILRVVRAMGGWRHLEMGETATRHFREKRFCELWEELGEADEARLALPSVAARAGLTGPQSMGAVMQRVTRQ